MTPAVRVSQMLGSAVVHAAHATAAEVVADSTLHPLVGVLEPASVGFPPVTPSLVGDIEAGRRLRRVRRRSGQVQQSAESTLHRARMVVTWPRMTRAEYLLMVEFFGPRGTNGGQYGFDIEPDGPGGAVVTVRQVEPAVLEWLSRQVYHVRPLRVEEVLL